MTTFKPGDKVRLVSDCFKRPEWIGLERKNRKFLAEYIGQEFQISKLCTAIPNHIHTPLGTCIPAALLEPIYPKKIATVVTDEMHDHKPKLRPDVGEWVVFDEPYGAGTVDPVVDTTTAYQVVALSKSTTGLSDFYVSVNHDSYSSGAQADRPIKKPVFLVNSLDKYHIVPAPVAPLAPTKHVYTPEQIAEARDISYRIMTGAGCLSAYFVWPLKENFLDLADKPNRKRPHVVAACLSAGFCGPNKYVETDRAVSFCSPDDEWNDDIGIMVALCKLTGTKLPDWVRGGK